MGLGYIAFAGVLFNLFQFTEFPSYGFNSIWFFIIILSFCKLNSKTFLHSEKIPPTEKNSLLSLLIPFLSFS